MPLKKFTNKYSLFFFVTSTKLLLDHKKIGGNRIGN